MPHSRPATRTDQLREPSSLHIFTTTPELQANQVAPMCPMVWGSKGIPRVVKSTFSAESITLSQSLDRLSWIRLFWALILNPKLDWRKPQGPLAARRAHWTLGRLRACAPSPPHLPLAVSSSRSLGPPLPTFPWSPPSVRTAGDRSGGTRWSRHAMTPSDEASRAAWSVLREVRGYDHDGDLAVVPSDARPALDVDIVDVHG